jgi:hypothetical protein
MTSADMISTFQAMTENMQAKEILRQAGMLAELTSTEKAWAKEWNALPTARKREVLDVLEHVRFQPTLSETIIHDRG